MPENAILQARIPYELADHGLPGVRPLDGPWLIADDAYAAQMEERTRLLRDHRDDVIARVEGAREAEEELLEVALDEASFLTHDNGRVTRPDGIDVPLTGDPLWDLGHLFQNDFVLMDKRGDEHVLVAAVLCFPASWTLAEKVGRPLMRIHAPVDEYDAGVAARVQRLFDGVQVDRPLWRFNALTYDDPALFQPRREGDSRPPPPDGRYLRSERQVILRLPKTRAVVFSIHTTQVHAETHTFA